VLDKTLYNLRYLIDAESAVVNIDALPVGDAGFVSGARPDVEASFPNAPFNYRAVRWVR
jgi:hypothetical protein